VLVALETNAEPVIEDAQVAIRTAHDGIRPYSFDFLCHDADIGLAAAVIGKPVVAKTIIEATEQHDVVLERDIGPPSATTAAATTTAATSAARTTTAATAPCTAATASRAGATTTSAAHASSATTAAAAAHAGASA